MGAGLVGPVVEAFDLELEGWLQSSWWSSLTRYRLEGWSIPWLGVSGVSLYCGQSKAGCHQIKLRRSLTPTWALAERTGPTDPVRKYETLSFRQGRSHH